VSLPLDLLEQAAGANKIDAKRHRIQIGSIATEKLGQVIEERTRFFEKKRGKKLLT